MGARPLWQRPPRPPEQQAEPGEQPAEAEEADAHLDGLLLRDQVRRQLLEDLLELGRGLGRLVRAAGEACDRLQGLLVDPAPKPAEPAAESAAAAEAVAGLVADELLPADRVESAALRRTEADRV